MSCKTLDRFRIHSRIDQISNMSMSMLMQCHLNTHTVNHFTIMRSPFSENRCYGMFDLLHSHSACRFSPWLTEWQCTTILVWTAYRIMDHHYDLKWQIQNSILPSLLEDILQDIPVKNISSCCLRFEHVRNDRVIMLRMPCSSDRKVLGFFI